MKQKIRNHPLFDELKKLCSNQRSKEVIRRNSSITIRVVKYRTGAEIYFLVGVASGEKNGSSLEQESYSVYPSGILGMHRENGAIVEVPHPEALLPLDLTLPRARANVLLKFLRQFAAQSPSK